MLKVLYRMYHGNAAIKHWFLRRVTPRGWGALCAAVVAWAMTVGNPITPLFALFGILLAIIFWSWFFLLFRHGKLSASRETPPYASVAESFTYQVKVKNIGATLSHFFLTETSPDPRPSWNEFSKLREPLESERNVFDRIFCYHRWLWIIEKKLLFRSEHSAVMSTLLHDQESHVQLRITPLRRGIILLDDLRLLMPDTFGFFTKVKTITSDPEQIIVLPKSYHVDLRLPGLMAQYQHGGDDSSSHHGSSGEFTALREYQHGDALRTIHWKSWARTGTPVVKEMEQNFFPRYALIFDTHAEDEILFEEAVSVAASVIAGVDTSQAMIDFMFVGNGNPIITAGRGTADVNILLEALAAVTMQAEEADYASLMKNVLSYQELLTATICVFNSWNPQCEKFVAQLRAMNLETLCLLVVNAGETAPENFSGHLLHANSIENDLRRLEHK